MERLILIFSILYSVLAVAKPSYQIDLIIFAHPNQTSGVTVDAPPIPFSANAISLQTSTDKSRKSYQLLSNSHSSLNDEYYLLTRKGHYQILGHYSWQQPANNQSKVALPFVDQNGWQMQGTLAVKQSNYYSFDAELQISPPSNPQESYIISQKQRLKENVVYYLDNAQIGMLVKIHS